MPTEIIWTGDLREKIGELEGKIHARMTAITHYIAQDMENYAKTNAPWKDRTGNARNGLKGTPEIVPLKTYAATISHSVPYGIWLEIRWAGKYAIILPTIRAKSVKMAELMQGLLRGI